MEDEYAHQDTRRSARLKHKFRSNIMVQKAKEFIQQKKQMQKEAQNALKAPAKRKTSFLAADSGRTKKNRISKTAAYEASAPEDEERDKYGRLRKVKA